MSLGAVLGSIFERPGVSWRGPGGVPGRPGGVPGRPWRPLGGLLELLKMLGPQRGGFWVALGRLLDRLRGLLGAKRSPRGGPRGSKIYPFLASFSVSILGPFWASQNHEKSYWRLGGKRIFTKSPISFGVHFEVDFGVKNVFKTGSKSHHQR